MGRCSLPATVRMGCSTRAAWFTRRSLRSGGKSFPKRPSFLTLTACFPLFSHPAACGGHHPLRGGTLPHLTHIHLEIRGWGGACPGKGRRRVRRGESCELLRFWPVPSWRH